ncbi:MAG: hypothetical protein WCF04_01225 [Candidatus Nanopelagicales bacterium]
MLGGRADVRGRVAAVLLVGLAALSSSGGVSGSPATAAEPAAVTSVPRGVATAEEVVCQFDRETLGEVSGITLSRLHENVLWATNDSGGGAYLYALDTSTCRIRATLRLLDTPARDHEALAAGQDAQGRDVIWVGDIGDNQGGWPYARIHKVIEPRRLADADVTVTTYRFTYPGGAVNAEAMMAAPDSEQLWVISKESAGGGIYALPSPMSDSRTPMTAKRVGDARALITDAAMAPNGKRYVVRDYFSGEVFSGTPPGEAEARFRLPVQPQGEAVTWTADSRSLLVASEGSADLIEVDVPASALGSDGGLAGILPRVAGFDIYPYVRAVALGLAVLIALIMLSRRSRRRRRGRDAGRR